MHDNRYESLFLLMRSPKSLDICAAMPPCCTGMLHLTCLVFLFVCAVYNRLHVVEMPGSCVYCCLSAVSSAGRVFSLVVALGCTSWTVAVVLVHRGIQNSPADISTRVYRPFSTYVRHHGRIADVLCCPTPDSF